MALSKILRRIEMKRPHSAVLATAALASTWQTKLREPEFPSTTPALKHNHLPFALAKSDVNATVRSHPARHTLLQVITFTALAFGSANAMAQPFPTPVPNASGSQVTNPATYGATANQYLRR